MSRRRSGERERKREDGDGDGHKEHKKHKKHKKEHGHSGSSGSKHSGGTQMWVREHIRVRIVDKRVSGGALYNKKGIVEDVSGAERFSVRMDENRKLVEGLRVDDVETVVPKSAGAAVMIVHGSRRLRRGRLLERDSKKARAMVQLAGDLDVFECSFDDVAEWVGEAVDDDDAF